MPDQKTDPDPSSSGFIVPGRLKRRMAPPAASEIVDRPPLHPLLVQLLDEARVGDDDTRIWQLKLGELPAGVAILELDGDAQVELLLNCLRHLTSFAAHYQEGAWRGRRRENELAVLRMALEYLLRRRLALNEDQLLELAGILGHFGLRGWIAHPTWLTLLCERYAAEHELSEPARRGLVTVREIVYWGSENSERRQLMNRFASVLGPSGETDSPSHH